MHKEQFLFITFILLWKTTISPFEHDLRVPNFLNNQTPYYSPFEHHHRHPIENGIHLKNLNYYPAYLPSGYPLRVNETPQYEMRNTFLDNQLKKENFDRDISIPKNFERKYNVDYDHLNPKINLPQGRKTFIDKFQDHNHKNDLLIRKTFLDNKKDKQSKEYISGNKRIFIDKNNLKLNPKPKESNEDFFQRDFNYEPFKEIQNDNNVKYNKPLRIRDENNFNYSKPLRIYEPKIFNNYENAINIIKNDIKKKETTKPKEITIRINTFDLIDLPSIKSKVPDIDLPFNLRQFKTLLKKYEFTFHFNDLSKTEIFNTTSYCARYILRYYYSLEPEQEILLILYKFIYYFDKMVEKRANYKEGRDGINFGVIEIDLNYAKIWWVLITRFVHNTSKSLNSTILHLRSRFIKIEIFLNAIIVSNGKAFIKLNKEIINEEDEPSEKKLISEIKTPRDNLPTFVFDKYGMIDLDPQTDNAIDNMIQYSTLLLQINLPITILIKKIKFYLELIIKERRIGKFNLFNIYNLNKNIDEIRDYLHDQRGISSEIHNWYKLTIFYTKYFIIFTKFYRIDFYDILFLRKFNIVIVEDNIAANKPAAYTHITRNIADKKKEKKIIRNVVLIEKIDCKICLNENSLVDFIALIMLNEK